MKIEVGVPDGVSGDWAVETFEISPREAALSRVRVFSDPDGVVEAGVYKKLRRGQTIVMSNTTMEVRTHSAFIRRASGSVLINGLGLGMALSAILAKRGREAVTDVTVIERSPDVIKLVAPTFADDPRVTIIEADAMTWQPPRGKRYDAVWHDIWDEICADNLAAMSSLKRRYGRRTDWQGCWSEDLIRYRYAA